MKFLTARQIQQMLDDAAARGGSGPGATDHGALTGTADDDHPQYFNQTRGDARYSQLGHSHSYDPIGTAAAAVAAHEGASDPHTQYLTSTEGNAAYAAASHSHAISNVTGLQTALDGKQAAGSYAASTHSHAISDVTGLQTALDGKQAAGSYAAASHTHTASEVTDFNSVARAQVEAELVAGSNITITPAGSGATRTLTIAASASGGGPTVTSLASDQATGANTTPVTLTGLSFSYAANSTYRIWAMGRVQPTAATTGCGFQFDVSSAVTSIDVIFDHQLANTGTMSGGHSIADDASVGVSSGMPGTSTYPVRLDGMIVTGANTGTAQLRFRSETTAVTTCKAGFRMAVEKIQ